MTIRFHDLTFSDSKCAQLFAATDWTATPLGGPDTWTPTFKAAVQLCLNARAPMTLGWGQDLHVIYNDGYLPILGSKHPDSFGAPAARAYPEIADWLLPRLQRVLGNGESIYEEELLLPLRRGAGAEEMYFTFSYSPVNDDRGEPQGVLAVATNVTGEVRRRRRASTAAQLSAELSRRRAADRFIAAIEPILRQNPMDFAQAELLELQPEGSRNQLWSLVASARAESIDASHLDAWQRSLAGAAPGIDVTRLDERWFAVSLLGDEALEHRRFGLLVRPDDLVEQDAGYADFLRVTADAAVGALYRMLAEDRELRHMSQQRDERERWYRHLFEHSRDGIFMSTPDGRVMAANPAACELLGYSEAEIRAAGRQGLVIDDDLGSRLAQRRSHGSSFQPLATPDAELLFATAAGLRSAEGSQGYYVGELRFRRKDGSTLLADVTSTLFRDELTGEERTITLFRDAAARLVTQERIAATARLEALGALTGGIAHDFNNLLNVIINGADDLREQLLDNERVRSSADLVFSASMRAADLTRQLLAFSRQQPMELGPVEVDHVLAELDEILRRTMGSRITVTVRSTAGLVASADHSLLQSALLNLSVNARDAMPDGGSLSVDGALARVDDALAETLGVSAGQYVRVTVKDTGHGIAPDLLERVLEPFFTTKPVGRGTGLGLSMVYGFTRQLGGALQVLSTPGEGTEVALYLPPAEGSVEPLRDETPALQGRCPGAHVLLVEDEVLLASMLQRTLENAGCRVTVCPNAEAAVECLEEEHPDLVVTDILLGDGMNGWQLRRHVGERLGVPVITMSGFTPETEAVEEPSAPMLRKPFRPHELLALVEQQLRAR